MQLTNLTTAASNLTNGNYSKPKVNLLFKLGTILPVQLETFTVTVE
jgi:hypothetical protein